MSSSQLSAGTAPLPRLPDTPPAERGVFVLPSSRLPVSYCSVGQADLPAVAILGGISAGSVVTTLPDGTRGWWDAQAGTGRPIDPARFRILGMDFISGPGTVTTADQAEALATLLNHLNIRRLHALVGASYGAMVGLAFAERFPERLQRLVAISGAHYAHPFATALRSIQRRILRLGMAGNTPEQGVAIARALAMIGYRSQQEFGQRFTGPPQQTTAGWRFPVDDYLDYHGGRYASAVSPEKYLQLSESLDLHRVDPAQIEIPVELVAAEPDWIVPQQQMQELADRLPRLTRLHVIDTHYGHDAFLKETRRLDPIIRTALGDQP